MINETLKNFALFAAILLLIAIPAAAEISDQEAQPASKEAAGKSTEIIDPALRNALYQAARDSSSFNDHFEAQVWLADMSGRLSRKVKDEQHRLNILKVAHFEARRAGLKPELVLAVIDVESNFNPAAVSRAGARGLMQVMPFWKKEIGKPGDSLFNVRTNLRYGCTILKYYLDKEKGNLFRALGRYNGSRGRWRYPKKVYQAYNKRWFSQ
jgi:soluble lytic murein transglycosylase-like protein